jgi:tRNA-specific 2-thiouridylase
MKTVYVGLSGGVDSSVAALLLKEQGFHVVGVYMKNWSQDLPGMPCPWEEDFQDAKRAAVQLGIEFKMYDFEKEYRHKVVDYMLEGFKAGTTPNPDIMCNQEIKFKLFLETALSDGADYVATGHYARVEHPTAIVASGESGTPKSSRQSAAPKSPLLARSSNNYSSLSAPPESRLLKAKDDNKDQTYFLYRVTQEALDKTLFPLGELTKPQVRELAAKASLVTATKKESMGICFVGKVGIKEFLSQFVSQKPGNIINQKDEVVGEHDGAIFYTIGQRQGLNVGGGLPYYVAGKDMDKNEVYVTTDLQDGRLWSNKITMTGAHWIGEEPSENQTLMVRTRHRAKLIPVNKIAKLDNGDWNAELAEDVRALTPGQSAVFYAGNRVLGGGIVI